MLRKIRHRTDSICSSVDHILISITITTVCLIKGQFIPFLLYRVTFAQFQVVIWHMLTI